MIEQPFAVVLGNTAHELDRLARLAARIDDVVGRAPATASPDGEVLAALQGVDLLRQSLECLTQYVANLASQVDDSVRVDPAHAAAALPLRDLARGLVGLKQHDSAPQANHGDTCFF